MSDPADPSPPDSAGRAISEEEVRVRSLPDHLLLQEFGGLDALIRFTSTAQWGRNEPCKPMVAGWFQAKLRVYVGEFVRRAAAARGVDLREAEGGPSRVDGLLARLRDPDGG